jgi:hypothetical protein
MSGACGANTMGHSGSKSKKQTQKKGDELAGFR